MAEVEEKGLPSKLSEEEVVQLVEEGRAEYMGYGYDPKYFAIIDGDLHNHTLGNYRVLTRNFRESKPIQSSQ